MLILCTWLRTCASDTLIPLPDVVDQWKWRHAAEVVGRMLAAATAFRWGRNASTLLYLDLGAR